MRQIGMAGLLAIVAVFMLLPAGDLFAQKAAIKVEAMSIHRLHEMKLPNPNDWDNVSTGLTTVGIGTRVWLSGWDVSGDSTYKAGTGYAWSFTSRPTGSTAAFDSTNKQWTTFKPDRAGDYVVKLTVSGRDTTVTITGSTYIGANRSNVTTTRTNCGTCHAVVASKPYTDWAKSDHAKMFENGMNAKLGSYWGESCFKCHTVGYNKSASNGGFDDLQTTLGFVTSQWMPWKAGRYDSLLTTDKKELSMYAGIGCESCHGPFKSHFTRGIQPVTLKSDVCAQCHDEPWRHNRYIQWEASAHSGKLPTAGSLRGYTGTAVVTNPDLNACTRCHDGQAYVNYTYGRTFDPRVASGYSRLARTPITCQTCHEPHSLDLRSMPVTSDTLGSGFRYTAADFGKGAVCVDCHKYRRGEQRYILQTNMGRTWGPHYAGSADVFLGQNGHTFGDVFLPDLTKSGHMSVTNTCVGCHMAATPDTGTVARDKIGMHTWEMKYVAPDGKEYKNLKACVPCHGSEANTETLWKNYKAKFEGMKKKIEMNLPPLGSTDIDRTALVSRPDSATMKKVFWNYLMLKYDGSYGIHNPRYATYLLQKSLQALGLPTDVELVDANIPATFELAQNYPNPFNPSTEIRFSLPKAADVKLEVYDITGRMVKTLVNENLSAGSHRVNWNASGENGQKVSSGVYLYRITAGEFVSAKKMVLLK